MKIHNLLKFIELSPSRIGARHCTFTGSYTDRRNYCHNFSCESCPLYKPNFDELQEVVDANKSRESS